MRMIAVWVTAIALISVTIIAWLALTPHYVEMVELVDEEVGDDLTGEAKEAYESVKGSGNNAMAIIGPAFISVIVFWAIMSMSKEERVTGRYRP